MTFWRRSTRAGGLAGCAWKAAGHGWGSGQPARPRGVPRGGPLTGGRLPGRADVADGVGSEDGRLALAARRAHVKGMARHPNAGGLHPHPRVQPGQHLLRAQAQLHPVPAVSAQRHDPAAGQRRGRRRREATVEAGATPGSRPRALLSQPLLRARAAERQGAGQARAGSGLAALPPPCASHVRELLPAYSTSIMITVPAQDSGTAAAGECCCASQGAAAGPVACPTRKRRGGEPGPRHDQSGQPNASGAPGRGTSVQAAVGWRSWRERLRLCCYSQR